MNELEALVAEAERLRAAKQPFALATITKVEGSAYRRPGTRMLVAASTATCGTISAGCLEGEVAERAARVLETGAPEVLHFNETPDDAGSFGTGCGGRIEVLVERVEDDGAEDALAMLARCLMRRQTAVLATVTSAPPPVRAGRSVLFLDRDRMYTMQAGEHEATASASKHGAASRLLKEETLPAGELGAWIEREAVKVLREGWTCIRQHETPEGKVEVLYELVRPPIRLVVFGAGPDVGPVVQFGRQVGWEVVVVGSRPVAELAERFPLASDAIFLMHPEQALERVAFDGRSAAVVMNHHYVRDRTLLRVLGSSSLPYIGVLGPRSRTDRMLDEIRQEGRAPDLERISAPIGLDIGTETPEEIALSVVAEIQAVMNGRPAGRLRDRDRPIHDPVSNREPA